jgi:hypothetical protein
MSMDTISYWHGDRMPTTWGPASDLIVLDLVEMPARPVMARWAGGAQVATVVAGRQTQEGVRRADVFDGRGRLVGFQAQTHRLPDDEGPEVLGDELHLFELGPHPIGIVVGEDVLVPEVSRSFALMGADLLLAVASPRLPKFLGIWRESQQNQVLGFDPGPPPMLTAPCEADAAGTGYIAPEALSGWFRVALPWGPLASVRDASLLGAMNTAAYLKAAWWSE